MHVGGHLPTEDPFAKTTFTKVEEGKLQFSVKLDDNGIFQSLTMPSGMGTFAKNVVKGWAAQFQINAREVQKGNMAFKSQEVISIYSKLVHDRKFHVFRC